MQNLKKAKTISSGSKKRKKMALGRGLDALLPDFNALENKPKEFLQCEINLIHPNPFQPRRHFSKNEMEELADSIKEQGVIQPLIVRQDPTGYELIAGERRLRAAKMAGLSKVPVVVKTISDTELLELSIVENIQREDLNSLEEADALQRLMDEFQLTQDQIAQRVGKSRPTVANLLRLRQLPEQVKNSIRDRTLSMGHARALLSTENPSQLKSAYQLILAKGLSVRQTENLIKRLKSDGRQKPKKEASQTDRYFVSLSEDLSRQFGTKVQIKKKGQKGKVEIEFYSNEDLDRLITRLTQAG